MDGMKRFVETEIAIMWLEKDILFLIWKEQVYIDLSNAKKLLLLEYDYNKENPIPLYAE